MGRRLTIDMFPGGGETDIIRRGDACDRKVMAAVLGLLGEEIDDSKDLLQNKGAYTKHYIGSERLYQTFRREGGQAYRYAGLCPERSWHNMHPDASQLVFIISPCHADTAEQSRFNMAFAKAMAREQFLMKGDIAIAPHLYFTEFMIDERYERDFGIAAGHRFMRHCDRAVCGIIDGRVSEGMRADIDYATTELALEVEYLEFTADEAARYAADYAIDSGAEMARYGSEVEHR